MADMNHEHHHHDHHNHKHDHNSHHHHEMMATETTTKMVHSYHEQHSNHHHHHDHGGGHNMMSMDMSSMHMSQYFTFHTSSHFLFEGLRINTAQGIAIAILITVILTLFFEGCNSFVVTHMAIKNTRLSKKLQILKHVLFTLLKTFSTCVGYLVMLAVMTYNVWILIAVILGSGISYLLIRPLIYKHLKRHHHEDSSNYGETNSENHEQEALHDFQEEHGDR